MLLDNSQLCGSRQFCFLNLTRYSSGLTDSKKKKTDSKLLRRYFAIVKCKLLFFVTPSRRMPPLNEFEARPNRGAPYWDEKQTHLLTHITRNATSKRKQTQPEDCFFSFSTRRQEQNSRSVRQTCRQKGQTVYVTVTILFLISLSTLQL